MTLRENPAPPDPAERLVARADEVAALAVAIQQIAAPTFAEHERAAFVAARFRMAGLSEVEMDERANVYGRLRGAGEGPAVMVSAHLDTVFPAGTDLATRREGGRLYGPGIGDNSLGVAALVALAEALVAAGPPARDLWFVANVGEEGLGDLNGMRAAVARLRERLGACVVLEGSLLGRVIHGGIGVERRRIVVETGGGHSWGAFGAPSAIHTLCRIGAEIAAWAVPPEPRTTFNLGVIEGGTSVNSIAARATAQLDMRSVEPAALAALVARLDEMLPRHRATGVSVRSEVIGSRPAALLPAGHPLVGAAIASLERLGWAEITTESSSTDANIPLSLGIPALCIGLTVGENAHREDEFIELPPLATGLRHALDVIGAALETLGEEAADVG